MIVERYRLVFLTVCFCLTPVVQAGPYTEAGINGFIDSDWRHADPADPDARINPIFRGWATGVFSYQPSPGVGPDWTDPDKALGPATGENFDIVSLGDLDQDQIDQGVPPGQLTLFFSEPNQIRDVNGYDFVVFENGFVSNYNTGGGSIAGEMFSELGYVEVSSDGVNFARFPAISLTPGLVGPYGAIEISNILNLVGKHPNDYGICVGTPFDLSEIANDQMVKDGIVDINNISYVRIVDVPGSGNFNDAAVEHINPYTWPDWAGYDTNHPIYDAWVTWGSGGLDLEAIGVLEEQEYSADINLDGIVDFFDFALFATAWQSHFGSANWIGRCDLAEPKDLIIDTFDLAVFVAQWLEVEQWRGQ